MQSVLEYWPVWMRGLWTTVWLSVCIVVFASVGSTALGVARTAKSPLVAIPARFVTESLRAPSAIVLLFWVFFVLPLVPGMLTLSPVAVAIVVLTLVGSAYGADIVRAGIESVNAGQFDACHALGLSTYQTLHKVIVPQALSQIVPAYGGAARSMIKWTSLLSFIGVQDVLYVANFVRGQTYETFIVLMLLSGCYWLLCLVCGLIFRAIEKTLPLNRALQRASRETPTEMIATAGVPQ
ncbi:amino acid ABC transporter permease [Bradyrhizobium sp. CIR3A]|uniref:amino acid ABC transporter permease n=1 Tax=Bradyrhizobium sp. CIR3A TaxID=2663838 RepID=UPI0016059C7D|nr:amino acid ABC transporter permease [Bradyrhizobium sp. CIR3A]MBB4264258.1 polar amino acid transport system permease protein [Bradyrhizobium sp. CIR3A]